jgi:hypothetical protein
MENSDKTAIANEAEANQANEAVTAGEGWCVRGETPGGKTFRRRTARPQ